MPKLGYPPGHILEPNAQLLASLDRLAGKFNEQAEDNRETAKTLEAAAIALRTVQNDKLDLQRQLDALKNAAAPQAAPVVKKPDGEAFTVLIDGSGSMMGPPLEAALEATSSLSKSGANITV